MGLDLHYQVIPDDCQLLARSHLEPDFGSHLEFFKSYALMSQAELEYECDSEYEPLAENRPLLEFVDAARQLIQLYPGIEQRNLDIDRKWDRFHYLLSPWRRNSGEKQVWDNWMYKAIFGSEILNPETTTTIGHPIRYLSPLEVYEIKDRLKTIDLDMFGAHWNPTAMSVSVYKIHQSEDDESFRYLQELFGQFKAFYAAVADREGVITCMS